MAVFKTWEESNRGDGKPAYLECILMLRIDVANQRELKASEADTGR
jgi:hypothetical protein